METKILILLGSILLFGCTKSDEPSELKGSWTWVSTKGGLARMTYTPESTGKNQELKINNRYLYYYENQTLTLKTKYQVIKSNSIYTKKVTDIIQAEDSEINQSFEINNDTLILREECFDCFTYLYTRSRQKGD